MYTNLCVLYTKKYVKLPKINAQNHLICNKDFICKDSLHYLCLQIKTKRRIPNTQF